MKNVSFRVSFIANAIPKENSLGTGRGKDQNDLVVLGSLFLCNYLWDPPSFWFQALVNWFCYFFPKGNCVVYPFLSDRAASFYD